MCYASCITTTTVACIILKKIQYERINHSTLSLLMSLALQLGFSGLPELKLWRYVLALFGKICLLEQTYSSVANKRTCKPYLILTKLPPCTLLFGTASLSIFLDF